MLGLIFQHQFAVVRDSETNSEGSDSWSTQTYHISWKAESSPEHLREAVGSMGLPGDSVGRESACNAGDKGATGSIPGSERSPRGGHGIPFQYSCLQNPIDRGAWRATPKRSVQFSSVTQLCPTLWDPVNHSMPGLPVHHQLPEFTQTDIEEVKLVCIHLSTTTEQRKMIQ